MRLIDADKMANDKYPYNLNHCGALDIAEWVNNQPTVNPYEWISVEDRLPADQKGVLCYYGFDRGDGDLGMMFMGTLCYFCFDENPHWQHADHNLVVTHWMPLPTPPTVKES